MDLTGMQPALSGLAPRRRRAPEPLADHQPVAQVIIERSQPHLDRVFDYSVPASMAATARPGVRVKVRFGGQDVSGFCIARVETSDHDLVPLRRVVSSEVVLTPPVLDLAHAVARRWVGTVPDVLRLAVPPRHARVEAEDWGETRAPADEAATGTGDEHERGPAHSPHDTDDGPVDAPCDAWAPYTGAGAFLRRIAAGQAPRAVWQALPGGNPPGRPRNAPHHTWADAIAQAMTVAVGSGRGALVVAPTAGDVGAIQDALERAGLPAWQPGLTGGWVRLVADDGPAARYRAFLAAARGVASVVVGTRAAAFAPVADLGLMVCWDDANGLHAEPRAPYPHVREVLAMRSDAQQAAVLVGGFIRSVAAQMWVSTGWARPLVAPRDIVRRRTPRVVALTSVELAREGAAGVARLPGAAWRAARDGLERGPVLVQVPRAGYLPVVACRTCRAIARCGTCAGPLRIPSPGAPPACRWCGRIAITWRCPDCGGTALRSVRVGSERTAEELGRAFPGVPVRVSGAATGILTTVPDRPALVVATPGAEPVAAAGYATALLLDAAVVTSRPALDVSEQALRTWMAAASLVRPAEDGGTVQLVGDAAPLPTQALVRWDPAWLAERELAERTELRLPPAVHVVTVDGPRDAVMRILSRADLPADCEIVGPAPLLDTLDPSRDAAEPAAEQTLLETGDHPVRAIVRAPWATMTAVADALAAAVATRAARREPGVVRVRAEPMEV